MVVAVVVVVVRVVMGAARGTFTVKASLSAINGDLEIKTIDHPMIPLKALNNPQEISC